MPEWWTYGLSDFLMFSPRTYYRLLERYNEAVWPVQLLTLAAGAIILVLLANPSAGRSRIIAGILALLWAWIAWAFLWSRYAAINWAVTYMVPMFVIEVVLLVWTAVAERPLALRFKHDFPGTIATVVLILSIAVYPLLAPLSGRPWGQSEVFGTASDPTVLGTLALALLAGNPLRWQMAVVPILWLLFSGATLLAMRSAEAYLLLPAAVLGLGALVWQPRVIRRR